MPGEPLVIPTDRGLLCPGAGAYIDPWRPVDRAIITHAHSDHAAPGCGAYLCAASCAPILRVRLGEAIRVQAAAYGERVEMNGVAVSLHPAGHIRGSAQVRIERAGDVTVVTGDYKTAPEPSSEPFEPVRCRTLVTESTFGLPIYRWPDERGVYDELLAWWRENAAAGRTSMLYAYALGKSQRILAALGARAGELPGLVGVHGALERINEAYAAQGVAFPPLLRATSDDAKALRGGGLVLAPPSAAGTPWLRRFGELSDAFASGWMRIRGTRRRRSVDRGFVISDHADFPGLLEAIALSGAERVGVTHGYTEAMSRFLRERGLDAFVVPTRYSGELDAGEGEAPEGAEQGGGRA